MDMRISIPLLWAVPAPPAGTVLPGWVVLPVSPGEVVLPVSPGSGSDMGGMGGMGGGNGSAFSFHFAYTVMFSFTTVYEVNSVP